MKVVFTEDGWDDYLYWSRNDGDVLAKLNALIEDVRRHLHSGLGKPEPLKGDMAGCWSRRITAEHRLVYSIEGKGADRRVTVLQCRFHYR